MVEGIALVAILRQLGGIVLQTHPLPGEIEGGPPVGEVVHIDRTADERPKVLLFVSPECAPCKALLPAIPVARRNQPEVEFISIVTGEDVDMSTDFVRRLGTTVRRDLRGLYEAWEIPGTPFTVGVDDKRQIVFAGVVNSLDQLEAVAESVRHHHEFSETPLNGHGDLRDHVELAINSMLE
jgi:thiol-disulfide isomerase/thioredoxin